MKNYNFKDITECEMCGAVSSNHKVMGMRLNTSQGKNPKKKIGIAVGVMRCTNCALIYSSPQPIPNGGKMIAYKGADGQLMLKTESQYFNPQSGNIEWDPGLITDRVIDPNMVAAEIAQTLHDLQILANNNKITQAAWKKYKLAEAENEKNKQ